MSIPLWLFLERHQKQPKEYKVERVYLESDDRQSPSDSIRSVSHYRPYFSPFYISFTKEETRMIVGSKRLDNVRSIQSTCATIESVGVPSRMRVSVRKGKPMIGDATMISQRRSSDDHILCETLSNLSDFRRTRHFHGLKRRESEANLDLLRSSGRLFQLLMGVGTG